MNPVDRLVLMLCISLALVLVLNALWHTYVALFKRPGDPAFDRLFPPRGGSDE